MNSVSYKRQYISYNNVSNCQEHQNVLPLVSSALDELKYQMHKEWEISPDGICERTATFMSKRLVTGSAPTATIGGGDTINQN